MTTPESKRAAPAATGNGSKKQMPRSSAGETYRDPAPAASSPGTDALRAAQANLAFGRTMLEAIELLREAHPDNEPLGAAFALMEPIETMLIDAVQAAERALPAEHKNILFAPAAAARPLGFEPNQAQTLPSGEGWQAAQFEELGGTAVLQAAHGRFRNGREGVTLRLKGCHRQFSSIRIRDHRLALIESVLIEADEPYAGELREMVAFLHHVLNEGGGL